jgi:hypothetical protein
MTRRELQRKLHVRLSLSGEESVHLLTLRANSVPLAHSILSCKNGAVAIFAELNRHSAEARAEGEVKQLAGRGH